MAVETVVVNRAPVLTLWAAVVAERQGHPRDTALTLGKAVAGLNAQSKGRSLGIFGPPAGGDRGHDGASEVTAGRGEDTWVEVCSRPVPAKHTPDGLRAVVEDVPIGPAAVERYLEKAFKDALPDVRAAMEALATAFEPDELGRVSYGLYEAFRPAVVRGAGGWGQKSPLDLAKVRGLAPAHLR